MIAHSGIGVAIWKGVPRPDISTPELFRQVLLSAKSVAYLDPSAGGTTGPHFLKVIERLGIADEIKAKAVLHRSGRAAAQLVAEGKAEIGINLVQEILPNTEVQVIGPLPGDLQLRLSFAAVILSGTHELDASKALIAFLRTSEVVNSLRAREWSPTGEIQNFISHPWLVAGAVMAPALSLASLVGMSDNAMRSLTQAFDIGDEAELSTCPLACRRYIAGFGRLK